MSVATVIAMSPAHTFDSAVQSASNPSAAGMMLYVDSDGNLSSTPPTEDAVFAVDPAMEHLLRHDSDGLTYVNRPDGTQGLINDGRYGDVVVMRVDENGKQTICVNDAKAYANGMTSTAPTGPEVK
jgi:hypothetical protein